MSDARSDVAGRFAGNSAVLFASYGFNTLMSAVVAVFLVRYLGGEEYGLFTTVFSYVAFFLIFTSVGVDTLVQREVARAPDRVQEIVGEAVGLRLLLSVASMVVAWLFLPVIHPSPRVVRLVVLLTLSFPFSFSGLYLVLYSVELRQGIPKLVMGAWGLVLSATKLTLIALHASLEDFVALEVVAAAVVFGLSVWLGRRSGIRPRFRWAAGSWRALLAASWPVALASTFIQVYLRVDQLMLYRFLGAGEVGLYAVPVRVVEFANVIPVVFMASAFPLLSRLWVEDAERQLRAIHVSFRAMAWVALPVGGYLFAFGDPLLPWVFGSEFTASVTVLHWLAWSLPPAFMNSVLYNHLFATGQQRMAAALASVAALLNVVLNLLLIGPYGGRGAAMATVASYALVVPLTLAVPSVRRVGLLGIRSLVRPGLAAAGALGVLRLTTPGIWAGSVLFGLAYAGLMVALREWGPAELALVRRSMGARR